MHCRSVTAKQTCHLMGSTNVCMQGHRLCTGATCSRRLCMCLLAPRTAAPVLCSGMMHRVPSQYQGRMMEGHRLLNEKSILVTVFSCNSSRVCCTAQLDRMLCIAYCTGTSLLLLILLTECRAAHYSTFVRASIQELVSVGCSAAWQGLEHPVVINGMAVARNRQGKLRLMLDCRYANMFIMYTLHMRSSMI